MCYLLFKDCEYLLMMLGKHQSVLHLNIILNIFLKQREREAHLNIIEQIGRQFFEDFLTAFILEVQKKRRWGSYKRGLHLAGDR